jgi:hypothetical protein
MVNNPLTTLVLTRTLQLARINRRAALARLAFINVAKFLETVMRSQHREGINNYVQSVIWVLRRFVDSCSYFESFVTP